MKGRRPGNEEEERGRKRETQNKQSGERKEAAGQMTGENNLCSTTAGKHDAHTNKEESSGVLLKLQPATLFCPGQTHTHTWSTVVLLHPDVTVALGHAGLGVQEGETHGALSTQAGIVAATVFNGLLIELLTKTEREKGERGGIDRGKA